MSSDTRPISTPIAEDFKASDPESSLHLEDVTKNSPSEQPAPPDAPCNWPKWKKNMQIAMVAFHSMMSTFMAAGIVPAYDIMSERYGVNMTEVSYLTSIQILLLGICPFFWKPLSSIYGRYPIMLLSVFGSMVCNIGGVFCTTYGTQMATRVLTAVLISPPIGIGSGVVTELCEPEERAQKLGWWTLMTTIGTPAGPFIMGFVIEHIGLQWVFWIFTILNFVQFVAYIVFGDETIYVSAEDGGNTPTKDNSSFLTRLMPRRINPRPLKPIEFIEPLFMARHPRVLIAACAHAVTFCYGNIAIVVEMPTAFGQKFDFGPQQIGLQYIAIIIGCVLGEQLSGPMSDWWLKFLLRRRGHTCPADRLWISYIGYGTVIAGLLTWGFQLQKASEIWNVTPCVGAAVASFGNQMLTTILTSFAVDSYKEMSTTVGVFVNICRQIFGFIGPFYFIPLFEALGLDGAAGVFVAIIGACSLIPIICIQFVSLRKDNKAVY
ncbi:MFS multidrug transporter [Aspergillus ruber CBS 135680]|uniref:MFS multidrug transporter n=1 Tax=Aspergillus ruber (strain CBS 135680) TaxID=1388766 RepID=A0A017SQ77_ASPRC|nr:MFS multidrug transporter [Aspergillus ruber CBS 135680]EYE98774.1 MFS multidrug transporter [Aspergillus ruber CBS 135680]